MRKLIVVFALVVAGCGGSGGGSSGGGGGGSNGGGGGSAGGGGASGSVDMFAANSVCGHPGDKGNSIGIGQYCTTALGECPSTAPICTVLNNGSEPPTDQTFFCTTTCQGASDTTTCKEDANCICQGSNCACVPTSCGTTAPGTNDMM